MFLISNHQTYINSGNSFSRAFLLDENFRGGKNLLVFDTKKEAEAFAKILAFFIKEPMIPAFHLAQVVDFFGRESGWFITTKELFEVAINWKYHVQKNTLRLERNGEISPDTCVTNFVDSGYTHSPYLSKPGTYKKDGDTLSIRLPFEEKVVALSFFDTIIDEILVFDTHGQFLSKKDEVSLPVLFDQKALEEIESREVSLNKELSAYLGNTQVIFINLDFWEPLTQVAKLCQKVVIFAGSTTEKSVNIGIKEAKITSLQELETLVKNSGKSVYFYTKHTKALRNFLEYNNLSPRGVEEVNIGGLQSFVI